MTLNKAILLQFIILMLSETEAESDTEFKKLYLKTVRKGIASRKAIMPQDQQQIVPVLQSVANSNF